MLVFDCLKMFKAALGQCPLCSCHDVYCEVCRGFNSHYSPSHDLRKIWAKRYQGYLEKKYRETLSNHK